MEDVVALRLSNSRHEWFGVITWGRLWDPIDDSELVAAVRNAAPGFGLEDCESVILCDRLAEISFAPYFYEGLIRFAREEIPFGDGYAEWQERMREALLNGRELFWVGELGETHE